ncbi:MAG: glycoside hydrolase family 2 protein [Bacteroidales bacterium]|jgi:beta-mannosidase
MSKNIKLFLLLNLVLVLVLFYSCNQNLTRKKLDLSDEWEFFYAEKNEWYPAQVPGNIHTDLFANNLIKSPYQLFNKKEFDWISQREWKYRKTFDIPHDLINRKLELIFEGLDTYATVFFNNVEIGKSKNMFICHIFALPDSLKKEKNNEILVVFTPSKKYNEEKAEQYYAIPDDRVFTRKSAYQYGWDFAPELETCGIFKKVYLNSWEKLRIKSVKCRHNLLTDTLAIVNVEFIVESENFYNAHLKVYNDKNLFDSLTKKIEIEKGVGKYNLEFKINNPKLWWCNDMGEPFLYNLNLELSTKFRKESFKTTFGLRDIELINQADEEGNKFYFMLNGKPVFARGANWVPAEYFPGKNNSNRYKILLNLAKNAGFNMIRVWGGGYYENDEFYRICDSLGIMVWQDFMFACAMYPLDEDFINNVSNEVDYQVQRLYNHPSIVMWCGNNEISNAWFDWDWQKQFNISKEDSVIIWNDYDKLFHKIIPSIIKNNEDTRPYIPTSPAFGWANKQSLQIGDSHYWGVWWGMKNFDTYFENTGRFMSEYGFQGFPVYSSLLNFIPKDSLYLYSENLLNHQKHSRGYQTIKDYLERYFEMPDNFKDYVYLSALMQAEGVQMAFDAHLSSMPFCMGTLFWQFNDCYPVVSWSAIDYYLNPKALYYYAARSFKNLYLSVFYNRDSLNVAFVNQNFESYVVMVRAEIFDYTGNKIFSDSVVNIADMMKATFYKFSDDFYTIFYQNKHNSYVIFKAYDYHKNHKITSRVFVVPDFKNLELPKPKLQYNVKKIKNEFEIKLKSEVFIKSLELDVPDCTGYFSDNYFDLLPGEEKTILFFPYDKKVSNIKLKMNSLNNQIKKEKFSPNEN